MTRTWRTLWLVIPAAVLSGFVVLGCVGGALDAKSTAREQVLFAVAAAVLALVVVRLFIAGLAVDRSGPEPVVHVRGVWRTRRVRGGDVAGLVMESTAAGRWVMPSVVTLDGRFLRARWSLRRAGGTAAAETAGSLAWELQTFGASAGRVAGVLGARGVEVRGAAARVREYRTPPTWPDPPAGWRPTPGWRPALDWPAPPADWTFWEPVEVPVVTARDVAPDGVGVPPPLPGSLDGRFALDREIAAGLPGSTWGLGEVVKAAAWLAVVLAVLALVADYVGGTAATVVGEGSIGLAVLLGARKAARQSGGWRRALGWSLPRRLDLWLGLRWYGWQLLAAFAAGVVLYLITLPLGAKRESNVDISAHESVLTLIIIIAVTVIMAPVVEEFLFRGLLLRALMRRFSFWPSALIDGLIFGLGHAPQVQTWSGRIFLAGQITTFGVVQCLLVRRTGRLAPAMVVHGFQNALVVLVTLA